MNLGVKQGCNLTINAYPAGHFESQVRLKIIQ